MHQYVSLLVVLQKMSSNNSRSKTPKEVHYAISCLPCYDPISKEMLFQRSAFEPTDAELGTAGPSGAADAMDEAKDDGMPIDAIVLKLSDPENSDSDSEPEYKPARNQRRKLGGGSSDALVLVKAMKTIRTRVILLLRVMRVKKRRMHGGNWRRSLRRRRGLCLVQVMIWMTKEMTWSWCR